jgi:hypothetical protein
MIYTNNTPRLGLYTAGGVLASLFVPVWGPAIATAAALTCISAVQDRQKATAEAEPEPLPKRKVSTNYDDSPLAIYQRRAAEAEKARRSIGFQID